MSTNQLNEEEYKNKENGGDIPDEDSTKTLDENGRNRVRKLAPLCYSLEDVKEEGDSWGYKLENRLG